MIDFIKYFFRIKKINFLLTFLFLLNFGIMFGAEDDEEEHKIEIKFEKKDKVEKKDEVEKKPFIMFLKKFCETFDLSTEDLNTKEAENQKYNYFTKSKYDFCFYYRDKSEDIDKVTVSTDEDFKIFYNNPDFYENVSTTRHLFFEKKENNEEENNNITEVYDNIIKNEKFKNISITVYINEDLKVNNEEEKKNEEKKEEDIKVNIGKNNHIEKKLNGNGDKKNNDCSYCNCCLDCFNHC